MAAYGFKPHRHLSGGVIREQEYLISASYTTKIHTGAPVKIVVVVGPDDVGEGDSADGEGRIAHDHPVPRS